MNPFAHRNHALYIENVSIADIAEHCLTPFYVYSATALRTLLDQFIVATGGRAKICYSVKANSNQAILYLLAKAGAGADIVSEGEGRRALAANIRPDQIFFSGAGKSDQELHFALSAGLAQINVESEAELHRLAKIAETMEVIAPIAIRVNPDIEAGGHDKISTGRVSDKFGVSFVEALALYQQASASSVFNLSGLAMHIGSQILSLEVFERAFIALEKLVIALRQQNLTVKRLDLGGGLGISASRDLAKDIQDYGALILAFAEKLDCEIILSPGRAIAGAAGCLVASVIEDKPAGNKHFLILDAAMNDLIRPALYDADHPVLPVDDKEGEATNYELVGPVCESGDVLARNIRLPPQKKGALIAIMHAGAYGAVLSSCYNSRLLIPEILVEDNRFDIIRPRSTYENLIALDSVPNWLNA